MLYKANTLVSEALQLLVSIENVYYSFLENLDVVALDINPSIENEVMRVIVSELGEGQWKTLFKQLMVDTEDYANYQGSWHIITVVDDNLRM